MNLNQVRMNNVKLLHLIDKVIHDFRKQNVCFGNIFLSELIQELLQWVEFTEKNQIEFSNIGYQFSKQTVMDIFSMILRSQENKDYILLADQLELYMVPLILQQQEAIMDAVVICSDDTLFEHNVELLFEKNPVLAKKIKQQGRHCEQCTVEYTQNGAYTLKYEGENECYFHSNVSPMREAEIFAQTFYEEEFGEYVMIGFGLGYHIKALLELDETLSIDIVEPDINIYCTAFYYEDYSELLENPNISFNLQEDFNKIIKDKKAPYHVLLLNPATKFLKKELKNAVAIYQVQLESVKSQGHNLAINFRNNIATLKWSVEECKEDFKNKTVYIVAAGPSLDKNKEQLKKVSKDSTILIVGTVFRKFLEADIPFDYVIMTDGNKEIYPQISGLEQEKKSLFILSTCYYKVAKNYQGKTYIICQQDYEKAEHFAQEKGYQTFQTGGSVLTTALDVAISLGAKEIVLVGADLAYTNGVSHSSGGSDYHSVNIEGYEQVEGIEGMVYAGPQFQIYRKWIEQRIQKESHIKFYNATEGGAIIKGMENVKLKDIVK